MATQSYTGLTNKERGCFICGEWLGLQQSKGHILNLHETRPLLVYHHYSERRIAVFNQSINACQEFFVASFDSKLCYTESAAG